MAREENLDRHYFESNISRLDESAIHDWYRFPFAYSDKIITDLVDYFGISRNDLILDPFNGTGTTTVTCKKLGIDSIGTDASPVSVFAARTKLMWETDLSAFNQEKKQLLEKLQPIFQDISSGNILTSTAPSEDTIGSIDRYQIQEPDQLLAGWLSKKPMMKMLILKKELDKIGNPEVQDLFKLAMLSILPSDVSNLKFGPTPYKTEPKEDADVFQLLNEKLDHIQKDLEIIDNKVSQGEITPGRAEILYADSREISEFINKNSSLIDENPHAGEVDFVITSPPYPNERDYTRIQRLELIWLDVLKSKADLQNIKKSYIRSNTKNIYVGDVDGEKTSIRDIEKIDNIVSKMEKKLNEEEIEHGFGRYYPRVIEEYFGGMCRHFEDIYDLIAPGGKLAYVVGDQATYWKIEVPTGDILKKIAEKKVGFVGMGRKKWRNRWDPNHNRNLPEEILLLEKPR